MENLIRSALAANPELLASFEALQSQNDIESTENDSVVTEVMDYSAEQPHQFNNDFTQQSLLRCNSTTSSSSEAVDLSNSLNVYSHQLLSPTSSTTSEVSKPFDREIFLSELQQYRCIWDIKSPSYKKRSLKENAWKELSISFGVDVDVLKKTLKYLKDNLKRCLDKRNRMTKSGAAAHMLPTCDYFKEMKFLHDKTANLKSDSNIQVSASHQPTPSYALDQDQPKSPFPISQLKSPPFTQPQSNSPFTLAQPKKLFTQESKKRKHSELLSEKLLSQLDDVDKEIKKNSVEEVAETEASLYARSLVPQLEEMTPKKLRLLKIQISQLIYKIQYGDDGDSD